MCRVSADLQSEALMMVTGLNVKERVQMSAAVWQIYRHSTVPFVFPHDDDIRHAAVGIRQLFEDFKNKRAYKSPEASACQGKTRQVCVCVCVLARSRYPQLPHHRTRGSTLNESE